MPKYQTPPKSPDLPALERDVLEMWDRRTVFDRLRARNAGGTKWRFLDGPITANNPMGVHHAWGRSLKDMFHRYYAMNGFEMRYQNGFDCQGLWVEVEVEKTHGFESKRDIETYGIAKFVNDCKERVRKYAQVQTEQSIRLGYWMDWDDSYFTMSEENNYTIWEFLRRCHDRGLVYKGSDVMPWCPRCEVGLSQMELHEGYRWVEDLSVFVKLPLVERENSALLVWTTTPWTLPANVAAAVNPELRYYEIRAGEWTYYVGADNWNGDRHIEVEEIAPEGTKRRVVKLTRIPPLLEREGDVEIVAELTGADMVGWTYRGPFDHLEAANEIDTKRGPDAVSAVQSHRVIPWAEVSGAEGTGIVHIAPGCGREDHELGKEHGLALVTPLDDGGKYVQGFGDLTGRAAGDVADDIVADLKVRGLLAGKERYPHRYPHCWRCKTAVVYRHVDEWFIDMQWRDEIMATVPKITWIPEYGEQLELDWLQNMNDWMISKKRYWGLALPIWQCDKHDRDDRGQRCDWFTVVGSRDELRERATEGWDDFDGNTPHRPWVDAVRIKCDKCGGPASRVPDVGNPWLDAGIVPYSTMGYNDDRAFWEQWFPSALVLECFPGQFRNWFYALLAMNTMMQDDRWTDRTGGASEVVPPFLTLLGHALVRDEHGHEMHKSAGNAIEFNTAAETIGADAMRYIYAAQNASTNLNFPDIGPDRDKRVTHLDQEVYRRLLTWWNCYTFYVTYAEVDGITPDMLRVPLAERSELDRWIWSKYQQFVGVARKSFEAHQIHALMPHFESFLDRLSGWYIRRSRRRFWKSEDDGDKRAAFATLFDVLEGLCRLMAPVLPFFTEAIYQNIVAGVDSSAPDSVHLTEFPVPDPAAIDEALETSIDTVVRYKNLGLRLRNQANIKIRQPLGRLLVKPATAVERTALERDALRAQVLEELNVKTVELIESSEGLASWSVRPNRQVLGPKHGKHLKLIIEHLGGADVDAVRTAVKAGGAYTIAGPDGAIELIEEDLFFDLEGPEGLEVDVEGDAFVALDTTITPELKREGLARDLVRAIQTLRKQKDLNVMDRIVVRFGSDDDELLAAVAEWTDYIQRETLADDLLHAGAEAAEPVKVGGQPVMLAINLVGSPDEVEA